MSSSRFVVLVPVKPPRVGKSRLTGLPDGLRRDLAEAFARDTVEAALAAPLVSAVLVVTDDSALAASLGASGCHVLPDGVSGDLNASLVQAEAEAARRWPDLRPAVLCADLPALDPENLSAVLGSAPQGPAFVADRGGRGTTLYTAPHEAFAPHFGPDSRRLHEAAGAVELVGAADGLCQDVDEAADLGRVMVLGVGAHTRRVMGHVAGTDADRPAR
ncbi:2-phospho-L-lactate guanylyltransferase [Nocardioides houyundeii]|uniref:2-phospho-L-lactate guanylyltransferase n=1 Tax=Nocardioides houyundeii TaxID=2045452 RepID=UPI000C7855D9|nr:2-phospho-L-lactate guanylyltransferase [Nocardioides houyundeii]